MKQLALQSEACRYLVRSFREWLATVGYNEQAVYQLPNYVQELLYYAEIPGLYSLIAAGQCIDPAALRTAEKAA